MIVLQANSNPPSDMIVLDPADLARLNAGRPAISAGGEVLITFTPHPKWLAAEIDKLPKQADPRDINTLLRRSQTEGTE